MDSDWDLHAVVRGCSSTTTSFPLNPLGQQKSIFHGENNNNNNLMGFSFFFPDLFQPRNDDNSIEQFLNDLYNNPLRFQKVQNTPPCSPSLPISPLSVLGGLLQQEKKKELQGKEQPFGVTRCTTSHAQSTTKFKKRKNQMKKVCQVAEGTSPDLWSWRKYGQKPIKGSPYPRGYYRCSTSKGCSARKQVERNRSDPGMLILTYTGDHNHPMPTHRNSLAGSSRNKPTVSGDDDTITNKPTSSSPVSPATSLSPATENTEENENRNRPTSSSPVSPATENSEENENRNKATSSSSVSPATENTEENENRNKPTSSSPVSPASENERDDTDDDNNFAVSGDVMDEDFFDGLDELVGSVTGDSFSDHLPASPERVDFWN